MADHRLGNKNNFRHGFKGTPTWNAWNNAKARCREERCDGRSTRMHPAWMGKFGFNAFLADMGVRPSPKHILARVDRFADFTPSNCCWVDKKDWGSTRIRIQESNFKHGLTDTPTWNSWFAMRQRCLNPKAPAYAMYGARGITVCEHWDSFLNFLADMGERPANHTIDRIDSRGNYTPENCRWATPTMQSRNTSAVLFEAHEPAQIRWLISEGYSQAEIARFFEVSRSVIGHIANGRTWKEEAR